MGNPQFVVASGPVIIENNKVLLNRHGKTEKEKRMWKFVGGKVEIEDYNPAVDIFEATCKREVKEEMGIDIEIITSLKPMLILPVGNMTENVILIHYLAKRIGEIKPGTDIVEWAWHDIDNLPENCAPNIAPVIESYKKLKENLHKM